MPRKHGFELRARGHQCLAPARHPPWHGHPVDVASGHPFDVFSRLPQTGSEYAPGRAWRSHLSADPDCWSSCTDRVEHAVTTPGLSDGACVRGQDVALVLRPLRSLFPAMAEADRRGKSLPARDVVLSES